MSERFLETIHQGHAYGPSISSTRGILGFL
jgi:hypothetical protein